MPGATCRFVASDISEITGGTMIFSMRRRTRLWIIVASILSLLPLMGWQHSPQDGFLLHHAIRVARRDEDRWLSNRELLVWTNDYAILHRRRSSARKIQLTTALRFLYSHVGTQDSGVGPILISPDGKWLLASIRFDSTYLVAL